MRNLLRIATVGMGTLIISAVLGSNITSKLTTTASAATPCIITVFGQQYDVSPLQTTHTGGNIFTCGTDMSATFQAMHGTDVSRIAPYLLASSSSSSSIPTNSSSSSVSNSSSSISSSSSSTSTSSSSSVNSSSSSSIPPTSSSSSINSSSSSISSQNTDDDHEVEDEEENEEHEERDEENHTNTSLTVSLRHQSEGGNSSRHDTQRDD